MSTTPELLSDVTSDLLHDLSRRLDSVWRYDQYLSNCDGDGEVRELWLAIKQQETRNIERLKVLLTKRISTGRL